MFKKLENSLMSTKSTKFLFGNLFLTCICECANLIDSFNLLNNSYKNKSSVKTPLHSTEFDKLIRDIQMFKAMSNKKGESYVNNFFRDDYLTDKEFTLFVRLSVKYPYSLNTDNEILLNISGPDKATALLRYYYIVSTVERFIFNNDLRNYIWFTFKPINLKDITRPELIELFTYGMPDSQEDDKTIRELLLKFIDKTCFTKDIQYNQNQIVYNVACTPWTWLHARRIKK